MAQPLTGASSTSPDLLYKVLMVGNVGTGKTSLVTQAVHRQFSDSYKVTVGVDFLLKIVKKDEKNIGLQIWDIAGQERFGSMTRTYYKDAAAAFVIFDLTNEASFKDVQKWKRDLDTKVDLKDPDLKIPIILIGNKADLEPTISDEKIQALVAENQFFAWYKTSAKTGENIEAAIARIVDAILARTVPVPITPREKEVQLDTPPNSKKGCGC